MKAIVYTQYGSPEVLELRDVEKPIPKDNEILIRIRATAVNSGDVRLRKADPFAVRLFFGLFKPKINLLGSVFSGEIESIGSGVQRFKVGDDVFGHTDMSFGTYASYKCFPEKGSIALKPTTITHQEVAVIPFGGTTALHFLKKASIQKSQKVLIFGASGAVGTAAVQLAKYFGANVTGVCSTINVDLVKSLGADKVIDYTKEDFSKNGETYDVIFDTVNKMSISDSLRSLKVCGTLILSAAGFSEMVQGTWTSITSSKKIKVLNGIISHTAEDINFLKMLIDADQLKPVIDRTYSLEQMVEAHTYVEKGHKKGNIAIEIY
ncbi:NAD(P)-dependent alcohol dehydrogenase [Flavobacterium taihuense]|uniref:NAD(P)-dependent alcohol dehydrogenase n=1 Tax=Flavobacterium taihuense TaxID=2857508 RepID=A0ABS6XZD0_9FLAO|nr:NAD(P)-dependent alcohol dehydrogenase [Flavobacterium taihuense]MBW4362035.1 NAD(P)-dependent alcohol dehydrogenase [Flavobacterium taihuense]